MTDIKKITTPDNQVPSSPNPIEGVDYTVSQDAPQAGDLVVVNGTRFHRYTPTPSADPPPVKMTVLSFKRRFTAQERIAIRASTDDVVIDFMDLLDSASEVDYSDDDLISGVNYLESQGLIATGRAAQIIG